MPYTDEFLEKLRVDPVSAMLSAIEEMFEDLNDRQVSIFSEEAYPELLDIYALLVSATESGVLPLKLQPQNLGSGTGEDSKRISEFLHQVRTVLAAENSKLTFESLRNKYKTSLGNSFAYEFSQGDLERVQNLLNEIRSAITKAAGLAENHRQRLLARLEKLQSELHKRVSDLDRFWGLVGDAGVVFGKLGKDAKPIVERIQEIAAIAWRTQSRAEELPSGTKPPSLEHKSDDENQK